MPRGRTEKFPEMRAYVREHASEDITRGEMFRMVQRDVDPQITYERVRWAYRKDNLPAKDGRRWNAIVPEGKEQDFMRLIPGRSSSEIQRLAKEILGLELTTAQIRTWKKNHKTPSGYDSRFRAGRISETKGKRWNEFMSPEAQERARVTQYHKGNVPKNRKQLGEVYQRSDGYVWIKIRDGKLNHNWTQLHRYIWEQEHGPIPEGHRVIFLDGNRMNCSIENLMLVRDGIVGIANKQFGLTKDPEINKTIIQASELINAITKAKKRKEEQ